MPPAQRLHRTVLWSGAIWLISFPLMLLYLAVIGLIGQILQVDFRSAEDAGAAQVLNLVYLAMVLGTLAVSVVIGLRGWRRHGQRLALAVAVLATLTGVLFLLLPVLA